MDQRIQPKTKRKPIIVIAIHFVLEETKNGEYYERRCY